MPYSSNATFLVHVDRRRLSHPAIYKPTRGERPLWDFEPGLHRREVATYLLSEHLGLGVIPPTVLRDGPLGEGSVQWFVPPTTASTTSRSTRPTPTSTTGCGRWRCSTCSPTTPTARAATSC